MTVRSSVDEITAAFHLFSADGETVTVEDFMRVAQELGELNVQEPGVRMDELKAHFAELIALANAAYRPDALLPPSAGGSIDPQSSTSLSQLQWRRVQQESQSDKRHRFVDDGAYSIKTRAKIAKRSPFGVRVEAGKTYYWCSCGMSKNQPFCDGSHARFNETHKANFQPVKYIADQTRTVWFCGCKQTKAPPLCDGSHTSL
jgi:CDGSH-type Zn-finger protein